MSQNVDSARGLSFIITEINYFFNFYLWFPARIASLDKQDHLKARWTQR